MTPRPERRAPDARATLSTFGLLVGMLVSLTSLLALAVRTGRILERTEMVASTVLRIEADQAQIIRDRQLAVQEWSVWRRGIDDHLAQHDAALYPAVLHRTR